MAVTNNFKRREADQKISTSTTLIDIYTRRGDLKKVRVLSSNPSGFTLRIEHLKFRIIERIGAEKKIAPYPFKIIFSFIIQNSTFKIFQIAPLLFQFKI
jgi:hypothetical protein